MEYKESDQISLSKWGEGDWLKGRGSHLDGLAEGFLGNLFAENAESRDLSLVVNANWKTCFVEVS